MIKNILNKIDKENSDFLFFGIFGFLSFLSFIPFIIDFPNMMIFSSALFGILSYKSLVILK
jgi:hypothetical protein